MDVSVASKGASRIKSMALVTGFAQGAIKVCSDNRFMQTNHEKFAKTCGHQDRYCKHRYGAITHWEAKRAITLALRI